MGEPRAEYTCDSCLYSEWNKFDVPCSTCGLMNKTNATIPEPAPTNETPAPFEVALDNALAELRSLLLAKHHDYGEGNLREFGEFGIIVRCSDKLARLRNLTQNAANVSETIDDTWRDLAGYAIQALIMRD